MRDVPKLLWVLHRAGFLEKQAGTVRGVLV